VDRSAFLKQMLVWALLLGALFVGYKVMAFSKEQVAQISYSEFYDKARAGRVANVTLSPSQIKGDFKGLTSVTTEDGLTIEARHFVTNSPQFLDSELYPMLRENVGQSLLMPLLVQGLPLLLVFGLFWYFLYRQSQAGGNRAFTFGKSRAKLAGDNRPRITFKDVAGIDEAKEELEEIVAFLRDPKKFTRLGARIPKGVLLYGPPGCGKTLLAKAIAGEASVPFYSISGSDFVEMFVGVGASRVRDLFSQARRAATASARGCIIFIDEIDAVGRQRFAGIGGGHDEREQTLNQLLSEMDGFDTKEGVILIAATNRPDVLDSALLRPGRFDRQIEVYLPDLNGRRQILGIYLKRVKVDPEVDPNRIARTTPGFCGADLENLINEAALLAARRDKELIQDDDFQEGIERVLAGPERKSRVISEEEKRIIAYHESGHAMLTLLIPETDPLHKVSIIPRGGRSLGYTLQLPLEDRFITRKTELMARMTVALGGRVAEELVFGEMSTGAQNDLEKVSEAARKMVCEYGMSEELGPITFREAPEKVFLGRDIVKEHNYSESVAEKIDAEVRRIVMECYERAKVLLSAKRDKLDALASLLIEREILDADEVRRIAQGEGDDGGKPAEVRHREGHGGGTSAA